MEESLQNPLHHKTSKVEDRAKTSWDVALSCRSDFFWELRKTPQENWKLCDNQEPKRSAARQAVRCPNTRQQEQAPLWRLEGTSKPHHAETIRKHFPTTSEPPLKTTETTKYPQDQSRDLNRMSRSDTAENLEQANIQGIVIHYVKQKNTNG